MFYSRFSVHLILIEKEAIEAVVEGYAECERDLGPAKTTPGGEPVSMDDVIERFDLIRTRVRYHG
jgi:hypothetical protein